MVVVMLELPMSWLKSPAAKKKALEAYLIGMGGAG